MTAHEIERHLHEHIPIARAFGVEVLDVGPAGVCLAAPIEPNLNHRMTAFGGSVTSVAMMAGWASVETRLQSEGRSAYTVIHQSSVRFDVPIESAFRAQPLRPTKEAWDRMCRSLERYGRGRVAIRVEVRVGDSLVALLEGSYVAIAQEG